MSQFKELVNKCTDQYLELKDQILHPETVWYRKAIDPVTLQPGPDYVWFSHDIIVRPNPHFRCSAPSSSLAPLATQVLTEILQDNGIEPFLFYRISVNCLPRQTKPVVPKAHVDHSFDYKHLIIYLNDADGDTVMYNQKGQIIARSKPKQDKVIQFGKVPHSGYFPVKEPERIVLVATYL